MFCHTGVPNKKLWVTTPKDRSISASLADVLLCFRQLRELGSPVLQGILIPSGKILNWASEKILANKKEIWGKR